MVYMVLIVTNLISLVAYIYLNYITYNKCVMKILLHILAINI